MNEQLAWAARPTARRAVALLLAPVAWVLGPSATIPVSRAASGPAAAAESSIAARRLSDGFRPSVDVEGIAELQRAAEDAERAGDDAALTEALVDLAISWVHVGRYEEATDAADRAIVSAGRAGDIPAEAWALQVRGDSSFYRARYDAALADYRTSYGLMLASGDENEIVSALKNIGIVYKFTGRLEEAVRTLREVVERLRPRDEPVLLASAAENLGSAYFTLGDKTRAAASFGEAVRAARASGSPAAQAHSLTRLAVLQLDADRPGLALGSVDEALAARDPANEPLHGGWLFMLRARALSGLGRTPEAIEALISAEALARRTEAPVAEGHALVERAALWVDTDPQRTLELLDEARRRYHAGNWTPGAAVDLVSGRARRRAGDLDGAIVDLARAVDAIDGERSVIESTHYRATFLAENAIVYADLAAALFERARRDPDGGRVDLERAFVVAERARARSLLEALGETRLGAAGGPLDERVVTLERRIAGLQTELLAPEVEPDASRELMRELDMVEEELQERLADLRGRDPRIAALGEAEPQPPAAIADELPAGAALVEYLDTGDGLLAFVVAPGHFAARRLHVAPQVVTERATALLDLVGDAAGGWRPVARRLHDELLAPVVADLPPDTGRLIVVPDGALNLVPFETLLDGQGRAAIDRWAISYAPSAASLRALSELERHGAGVLLMAMPSSPMVAGPAPHGSTRELFERDGLRIGPIPGARREADAVSRAAGARGEMRLGRNAAEAALKALDLSRFAVIHFATHGLIGSQPERSALLLAAGGGEDGFLQARVIHEMRVASSLVVLSACRSARGRVLPGEGMLGLARAFLQSGARSVVASLWDADDGRTAEMMERFYVALADGLPADAALRRAKLAVRDEGAPPLHWAGFVVIGRGDTSVRLRPHRSPPAVRWAAAIALVLAVALIARGAVRRAPLPGKRPVQLGDC